MIVEDEADISEMIALHLAREGHESIPVSNGLQVVPTAIEQQPVSIRAGTSLPSRMTVTASA